MGNRFAQHGEFLPMRRRGFRETMSTSSEHRIKGEPDVAHAKRVGQRTSARSTDRSRGRTNERLAECSKYVAAAIGAGPVGHDQRYQAATDQKAEQGAHHGTHQRDLST
jgi:hypothetical protein